MRLQIFSNCLPLSVRTKNCPLRQVFIIAVNFEMCLACVDLSSPLSLQLGRFCLNDPSKNDADAVDRRSLLARSAPRCTQANGTLLSEARLRRMVDTLYSHGRVTGVIFPRQSVRKRGTGTKWNPSLWTRHARQELRNDRDFARGSMREGSEPGKGRQERHPKACWDYLHIAGMEMAPLGRNSRECMLYSAPDRAHSRFAGGHGIMNFSSEYAIHVASTSVFIRLESNTGFLIKSDKEVYFLHNFG